MGAIATISIDLAKLDKSKIVTGKNGQKYYNLNLSINDQTDQYGNNIQVTEPQTKEQRDVKEQRTFYGNGKVFWTDGQINKAEQTAKLPTPPSALGMGVSEPDDLPF
jgi:hypothetical protein